MLYTKIHESVCFVYFCLPGGNIEISCDKHIHVDDSSSVKGPKDGIYQFLSLFLLCIVLHFILNNGNEP